MILSLLALPFAIVALTFICGAKEDAIRIILVFVVVFFFVYGLATFVFRHLPT
jgi:hypothetical protein